jgi:hypothetical protein
MPYVGIFISNKQNVMFFFLPLSFFFYKIGVQDSKTVPVVGGGEVIGIGGRGR